MTFESTKLVAASVRTVEWHKFHAHTSFLSEVIQILMYSKLCVMYVHISSDSGVLFTVQAQWVLKSIHIHLSPGSAVV